MYVVGATSDLALLIANKEWPVFDRPFPHCISLNVFVQDFYERIEASFRSILARGLAERPSPRQFSRTFASYDAYGAEIPLDLQNPLRVFVSRAWHDMLADVFKVRSTGDIAAGLHHHEVGSANGQVHNDLNPGWFVGHARQGDVNISNLNVCNYKYGECRGKGIIARETVRAVAMLFYVNNPPWHLGDGGETGLYETLRDPVESPVVSIPPLNNSMLAFECTPYSFHSFIGNRRSPRDCITVWLHRSKDDACARWGEDKIIRWQKRICEPQTMRVR